MPVQESSQTVPVTTAAAGTLQLHIYSQASNEGGNFTCNQVLVTPQLLTLLTHLPGYRKQIALKH